MKITNLILSLIMIFLSSCGSTANLAEGLCKKLSASFCDPDFNPSEIAGYNDVAEKCNDLSKPLGDLDMVTGAGQSGVAVPARANIIELDADIATPYDLSQPDTEYRLTGDILSSTTAFTVSASKITLNLNNHTITYGTENAVNGNSYGITVTVDRPDDLAIVNGRIVQGSGSCSGIEYGLGCNPISFEKPPLSSEIAGLEIIYHSPDSVALYAHWGSNMHIHHNRIEDKGDVVDHRSSVNAVISAVRGENDIVHHNLIVDSRQTAIIIGESGEAYNNEIYINSSVTNSAGISLNSGNIYNNKIFGAGFHPIGIWPSDNVSVYSNYVEVEHTRSGEEYENPHAACLRMTWGNDGVEILCNHFELHSGHQVESSEFYSRGRCIWAGLIETEQTAEFHHNFIRATNADGKSRATAIGIVHNFPSDLIFWENAVSSNYANVVLGDDYGENSGYPLFLGNHFTKEDDPLTDDQDIYMTIKSEYSSRDSTGIFLNTSFSDGASFDKVDLEFWGTGRKEIAVGTFADTLESIEYYLTNVQETIDNATSVEDFGDGGYKAFP